VRDPDLEMDRNGNVGRDRRMRQRHQCERIDTLMLLKSYVVANTLYEDKLASACDP